MPKKKQKKQKKMPNPESKEVRDFIEKKVEELGTMEKVEELYRHDDIVSAYAVAYALEIFKGENP